VDWETGERGGLGDRSRECGKCGKTDIAFSLKPNP
jgi:hypothetical protein